ncbi:MAG: TetR/AcrR family transcriptional regulator, partial [Brevibacterium sp.]|nr:TetR/AcrR family transcriptional regulator [Brevibacterium sp.]
MTEDGSIDTRSRLLNAAADLIAAAPGEDFSLRAVCDVVGVKMPTLYHFFGSKQGLIEAVIEHGFDMYLSAKYSSESSGD